MKTKILLIYCLIMFASFGFVGSLSMSMMVMGSSHSASCPFSLVAQGDCDPYNSNATIMHGLSVMRIFSYVTTDFFKGLSIIVFPCIIFLYFLKVFLRPDSFWANEIQNNFYTYGDVLVLRLKKIRRWISLKKIWDPCAFFQAHEVFVL